jgi:hypothetical protein
MQMKSILKSYNRFLIHLFKYNKITILLFSTATALGYLSLPYLEKYHKSIKEKNDKLTEDDDVELEESDLKKNNGI